MKKRILAVLTAVVMCLVCFGASASAFIPEDDPEGVGIIVFTNDVHCGVEDGWTYAGVANIVNTLEGAGVSTLLVDAGDHAQGGPIGTLSNGEYIIDIMNQVGYDLAIPGNHEFDYTVPGFFNLVERADFPYISSNFMNYENGQPTSRVFDAYKILDLNGVKIGFVGITTPETITKSTPTYFQDENGNYIYGFCQDSTGAGVVAAAQEAIDAAYDDGADMVIILGHCGTAEQSSPWRSDEIIPQLHGVSAFIDGHSHFVVNEEILDADGEPVVLVQTGTKLANVGMLAVFDDGSVSAELYEAPEEPAQDPETAAFVAGIMDEFNELLSQVVVHTDYDLVINDPETGDRIVRKMETNLGDICADAYRYVTGADIAFVNGGGVRKTIAAGDVTFEDIINVHPFGNAACIVRVTGQQILDALEMGARNCPGENGGFLQVSGLTYEIHTDMEPNVVIDDDKMWVGPAGIPYRVQNVMVLDSETGEYLPLDLDRYYTLASHDYMLINNGDGFTMFGKDDCEFLMESFMLDNAVLINYFASMPAGENSEHEVVGYENPYGEGRITIVSGDEPGEPTDEPAPTDIPDQPAPPATGAVSLIGIGVAAVAVGAGIVVFRKKRVD